MENPIILSEVGERACALRMVDKVVHMATVNGRPAVNFAPTKANDFWSRGEPAIPASSFQVPLAWSASKFSCGMPRSHHHAADNKLALDVVPWEVSRCQLPSHLLLGSCLCSSLTGSYVQPLVICVREDG